MTRSELEDRYLEAALEERLGGIAPPDLSARILARARGRGRRVLAAAALLLVGVAVVWAVADGARDDDPTPAAPQDPDVVVVRTVDELRGLLPQVTRARVRPSAHHVNGFPAPRLPLRVRGEPPVDPLPIPWNDDVAARLLACVASTPMRHGLVVDDRHEPEDRVAEIALELAGGRRVELEADFSRPSGHWVRLPGLGTFGAEPLVSAWLADIHAAGRTAAGTRGVLSRAELDVESFVRGLRAERLRPHAFERGDLGRLPRAGALRVLDLRYSPELHTAEGVQELARFPGLRELYLDPAFVDAAVVTALGESATLHELLLVPRGFAYWDRDLTVRELRMDASVARALARLTTLRTLAAPGAMFDDAALEGIAALPRLEVLVLSGARHIDGAGLAGADRLRELYLCGCTGLDDQGVEIVAALPALEELYLDGARVQTPAPGVDANLGPASLRALAHAPKLRRLDLGGWFARRVAHPTRYADASRGPVFDTVWREALFEVVAGDLETLSLAHCSDLTLPDLEPLCDAQRLRLLFLNGTAGELSNMIPLEAASEMLLSAVPELSIVTD